MDESHETPFQGFSSRGALAKPKSPAALPEDILMSNEAGNEFPCAEKMVFDTKAEAEATAIVAGWQHGSSLKPYECQYCHLWHLATKNPE